jgi:hypothetical protein
MPTSRSFFGFDECFRDHALSETSHVYRGNVAEVEAHSARIEPQLGISLSPRPLKIIGTHFSTRADLVFGCLALETWKMYDFLRPGESAPKAALRTALSSSLLCDSSGIGYSEGFLSSTFLPDFSNAMAS